MKTRTRYLTILLLKDSIRSYDDALKDPLTLQRYDLKQDVPFRGALYVRDPHRNRPDWVDFVLEGIVSEDLPLETRSQSSVLFIESCERRLFAITFGYGRYLLKPNAHETDFGLKTALNAVNPVQLRSVDLRTFQEAPIHTRRQASRSSALDVFGVDTNRDVLRSVTGIPSDAETAARLTGSDSLTVAVRTDFNALAELCSKMYDLYLDDSYKDHFGWIDHLRIVRDQDLIETLDEKLVRVFQSYELDHIHLCPPENIDWERTQGFIFSTSKHMSSIPDLDIEAYLGTVKNPSTLSRNKLKDHRVIAHTDDEEQLSRWSVYDCTTFETEHEGFLYVLTGGCWFQVAADFAASVNSRVNDIPKSDLILPCACAGEREEDYNRRVAECYVDIVHMDKTLVRGNGWNSLIEVCDLFTRNRQFIHVKKRAASSIMSHLFAQGLVSAEAFLKDGEYRTEIRQRIEKLNGHSSSIVPDERPNPRDFEVVYALIGKPDPGWPLSLPFFSKVHLSQAVTHLELLGFRVSLCHVSEV